MANSEPAEVTPEQRESLVEYFKNERTRLEASLKAAENAVRQAVSQRDHLTSVYGYLTAQIDHHSKPED